MNNLRNPYLQSEYLHTIDTTDLEKIKTFKKLAKSWWRDNDPTFGMPYHILPGEKNQAYNYFLDDTYLTDFDCLYFSDCDFVEKIIQYETIRILLDHDCGLWERRPLRDHCLVFSRNLNYFNCKQRLNLSAKVIFLLAYLHDLGKPIAFERKIDQSDKIDHLAQKSPNIQIATCLLKVLPNYLLTSREKSLISLLISNEIIWPYFSGKTDLYQLQAQLVDIACVYHYSTKRLAKIMLAYYVSDGIYYTAIPKFGGGIPSFDPTFDVNHPWCLDKAKDEKWQALLQLLSD